MACVTILSTFGGFVGWLIELLTRVWSKSTNRVISDTAFTSMGFFMFMLFLAALITFGTIVGAALGWDDTAEVASIAILASTITFWMGCLIFIVMSLTPIITLWQRKRVLVKISEEEVRKEANDFSGDSDSSR